MFTSTPHVRKTFYVSSFGNVSKLPLLSFIP